MKQLALVLLATATCVLVVGWVVAMRRPSDAFPFFAASFAMFSIAPLLARLK